MAKSVLVTGGAGRLGSAVVRVLCEAGFSVRAVDLRWRRDLPVPVEAADLRDAVSVYRFLDGCEAVVHLANHPGPRSGIPPQQLYCDNVAADMNVFQAAADVGAGQLVFASSVQAFCGTRQGEEGIGQPSSLPYLPLDGEVPACPGNEYGLSKEAGEAQLRCFARTGQCPSCAAVRFPLLMMREWLRYFRHRHRGRRRHLENLDEAFAYLAVNDAALLVLRILERPQPGYHQLLPAAPDPQTDMPIPEIIGTFYPDVPLKVPAEQMESLVDISGLERDLGWVPQEVGLLGRDDEGKE